MVGWVLYISYVGYKFVMKFVIKVMVGVVNSIEIFMVVRVL